MRSWYSKIHVWVTIMISAMAAAMVGLVWFLIPTPDEIILIAQRRLMHSRGFGVESRISYESQKTKGADVGQNSRWRLEATGVVDRAQATTAKLQQDLTFNWRLGSGAPIEFRGEYRAIPPTDYVRFRSVPERFGSLDIQSYRDKWLSYDRATFARELDLPVIGRGTSLEVEEAALLEAQLTEMPYLKVTEKLKNDKVRGINTYHFLVRAEPIYLREMLIDIQEERFGRDLTAREREAYETFFGSITPDDGEIWIGRRDFLPYRLRLRFRYDGQASVGMMTIALDFSDFGRIVTVTPPTEKTERVDRIIQSMLPGFANRLQVAAYGDQQRTTGEVATGGLPTSYQAQDVDPDKDGLDNTLEFFYRTDPNNPDTDGDGVSDGDEVARGDNPSGRGRLFDFGISGI